MKKKLILLLIFMAIVPLILLQWVFILPETKKTIEEQERLLQQNVIRDETIAINNLLESFRSETKRASFYPPIQGMIRAEKTGMDELEQSTLTQWKERLKSIFIAEMRTDLNIFQLRYIDDNGREIIKVERRQNGIFITPDKDLQDKSDTYYFQNTIRMAPGEVYISRMNLNREYGVIQFPHVPVLRFGIPVFDDISKERKGAIIMNVFTDSILKSINQLDPDSKSIMIDQSGQYLIHPNKEKLFSTELENFDHNYFTEHPEMLSKIQRHNNSDFYNPERDELQVWQKIFYNQNNYSEYWILFKVVKGSVLREPISALRQDFFIINGLFLLFLIVFSALLGRYFTKPLNEITHFAQAITKGKKNIEFPPELLDKKDEVGHLSKAFQVMLTQIQKGYKNLEREVFKKTKNLQEQNEYLESTKMALSNILEDIEEEKRRSVQLATDLEKFKLAVENTSSEQIVITDPEGIILYANPAIQTISGFTPREVLGKKAGTATLWGGLMPKEHYTKMWDVIKKKKKTYNGTIKNRRKNGEVYDAKISISPVLDEEKQVRFFMGSVQDITKEKQVDRMKTEFVSLASHQLRTPLSAINWYTEMLLDGDAGEINKSQKEFLDAIHNGNQRMIELVNSLLNVSRIELGTLRSDPEEIDPKSVAQNVINELSATIKQRKQKFNFVYDDSIGIIYSDPKLINIIFQNLLSNAVKYTPEKGSISCTVKKQGKNVSIDVKDSGYGIPDDQKDKIFSKLFRADNVRVQDTEGNGLGLYLVKSIVEKMKGKIWFKSKENKGTTFYITIPLASLQKPKTTKKTASPKKAASKTKSSPPKKKA